MTRRLIRLASECVEVADTPWGALPRGVEDPTLEALPTPTLHVPSRIPAALWSSCTRLAQDLASEVGSRPLEVGAILARSVRPPHDRWAIFVPEQVASGAAVKYSLEGDLVNIATGDVLDRQAFRRKWAHAGSWHSHNNMDAFWSAQDTRDDANRNGLHVVVGSFDNPKVLYRYKARVCWLGRLFDADDELGGMVELAHDPDASYPEAARKVIKLEEPKTYSFASAPNWTPPTDDQDAWWNRVFSRSDDTDYSVGDAWRVRRVRELFGELTTKGKRELLDTLSVSP